MKIVCEGPNRPKIRSDTRPRSSRSAAPSIFTATWCRRAACCWWGCGCEGYWAAAGAAGGGTSNAGTSAPAGSTAPSPSMAGTLSNRRGVGQRVKYIEVGCQITCLHLALADGTDSPRWRRMNSNIIFTASTGHDSVDRFVIPDESIASDGHPNVCHSE